MLAYLAFDSKELGRGGRIPEVEGCGVGLSKFCSLACKSLIFASCSTADMGLFFFGLGAAFGLGLESPTGAGGGGGGM